MRRPRPVTPFDPFEVILCSVLGLSGLLQLFYPVAPLSAAQSISHTSHLVWLVATLAGCGLTLVGLLIPRVLGYLIEEVGLVAVGGSLIAYGAQVTLVQVQHGIFTPTSIAGGPLLIGLGLGFFWKMLQVRQKVNALGRINWSVHR